MAWKMSRTARAAKLAKRARAAKLVRVVKMHRAAQRANPRKFPTPLRLMSILEKVMEKVMGKIDTRRGMDEMALMHIPGPGGSSCLMRP